MATSSFLDLRRNSNAELEKIAKAVNEQQGGGAFEKDPRYWQPLVSKEGNGIAVIRFLPAPQGEDVPFVRKFSHGFKVNGKWYIENSLTTLGQKDPVGEYNSKMWATEIEANKEIARKQKRKLGFISNIQVLKHPARPEDEGKVFLYGYGKKIFDKINDKMTPSAEMEALGHEPMNPFDFWTGANFILRIKKVGDFRNYDDSAFEAAGPLKTDDAELEAIWKSQYSLAAEIAPDKFKSYAELEAKFLSVIGSADAPKGTSAGNPAEPTAPAKPTAVDETAGDPASEMEFFKRLANNASEEKAPF